MNTRSGRIRVFLLTFLSYMTLSAARLPYAIVKSTLHPKEGGGEGWAPFNADDGGVLLGTLDTIFLCAYSVGLFLSGHFADRLNLRLFLSFGMFGAGGSILMYGAARWLDIHSFWWFCSANVFAGLFQSIGWPSCVACMGNWFVEQRGLVYGCWNSHCSVGNVLGKITSTLFLVYGWQWSFAVPGFFCITVGFLLLFFLVPHPREAGLSVYSPISNSFDGELNLQSEYGSLDSPAEEDDNFLPVPSEAPPPDSAVSFWAALKIPGVAFYAASLFFSKLVSYAFIFWLPYYLFDRTGLSTGHSGNLSTLYDFGGFFGGAMAGYLSDRLGNLRAIVSVGYLIFSVPALYIYYTYSVESTLVNCLLMVMLGLIVNSPYALISSAVSADLGEHSSLKANSKALATVTGIIDGTGSVGASLQGFLIAWLRTSFGWKAVYDVLMIMCVLSIACLWSVCMDDIREIRRRKLERGRVLLRYGSLDLGK